MAGYIALGWWVDRPIRLFGYPLHLPRPRTAIAQVALSVADLSLVAAVLYACLPHASAVGYPHVLAVYVLAFVVGLISHVPGGLGVFDAVVLVGFSTRLPADQILAGLLVFRVVYQLVPLVSAGAVFGAVEVLAARRRFAQRVENISIWVGAVGPTVLAGCVFMGGVTLLFSNAMPVSSARLRLVETTLPLEVIELSHLVGSIDGVLMLVSAYGLQQRSRSAWAMSAVLLWVGAVSLMLKGFAWEEASGLALTNDSSGVSHMRVWLDEKRHRGPGWSGRPGTAGSGDRLGEQSAEACMAGADRAAERRWGWHDGHPAADRQGQADDLALAGALHGRRG
jgi:phosphatidylglycerol lysyltransferase